MTPQGMANLGHRDRLAEFMKGIIKHSYTQNIKSQRRFFYLCFPHYNPMGASRRHGNQIPIRSYPKPNATFLPPK